MGNSTGRSYKSVLTAVSYYVPPTRVTNHDLAERMDTSHEWIVERTGIRERRFAPSSWSTSDLAIEAIKSLFKNTSYKPEDFDYIIAATLSPDHYYPGIAPTLQHALGFKNIPALDIRVQCSAFVYGTQLADALIRSNQYKRILLVCTDLQSKFLEMSSRGRGVSILFSDGAGVVVYEATPCDTLPAGDNRERGVIDSLLSSDGSGAKTLLIPAPGTASPHFLSTEDFNEGLWHPKMEGRTVFKHAVNRMCEISTNILKKNHLTADQVHLLVPHQANLRISEALREKLELPPERVFNNIECYGNSSSATIPICLSEAEQAGLLKPGQLVLTVAFGAGFLWGANLIRF
jgi:3-oxoacyl-[acyl-carrier-protein] synthase III